MWYHLVAIVIVLPYNFAQYFPDQKLRQCDDGELSYQRLARVSEDTVTFYLQTPAQSERDCVLMCYERLQFCNSVKFVPDSNLDSGTCSFAYYHGDCVAARSAGTASPNRLNLFGCIRCIPFGPSFIQGVEDTNEVGPALLIQQNIVLPSPTTTTTAKPDVADPIDSSKISQNNLSYREYKTFSFLLPECTGNITFSAQPTLMMTKPSVYTAGMDIKTLKDCATLCYRQHFCTSAIWRSNECLLSYERSSCADKPLPKGYKEAALITCIHCEDE